MSPLLLVALACAAADSPDIVFIISDDLTAEALACYGNEQCRTPNIDRLAERGVKFTAAYCQYPVCGPSRAAMMSGMYPESIGVTGNGSAERFTTTLGDRPSMSQHFRNNGYYAARCSKIYHMRVPGDITKGVPGPDHAASWDETFNAHAAEWMTPGRVSHMSNERLKLDPDGHYSLGFGGAFWAVQTHDRAPDGPAMSPDLAKAQQAFAGPSTQPDDQATEQALRILKERNPDKPLFLAIGYVRPHVPLVAPESYFEHYPVDAITLPETRDGDYDDIPKSGLPRIGAKMGMKGPRPRQEIRASYYACVEYMDSQVGQIVKAVQASGRADNTIFVFTSDHGYFLGEHDFWSKMGLHEESVRIPMIIAGPNVEPGVTDSLAQQIDYYPTLSELSGLEIPEHIEGKSLVPVLSDKQVDVHEAVFTNRLQGHLVRTKNWAYMQHRDGAEELYDMASDPQQFTNVVDDLANASVRDELRKRLEEHHSGMNVTKRPGRKR